MKNLKLLVITVMFATAIVNLSYADGFKVSPTRNVIKVTFQEAIQNAGLVIAMHQQLNGGFLGGPVITRITLTVYYQNYIYLITGTSDQWSLFFNSYGITEKPIKKVN